MRKHLLIGGNGAVGAVFGLTLQEAGHDVTLYVKEKYVDEIEENNHEILLHDLNSVRRDIQLLSIISWILLFFLTWIFGWVSTTMTLVVTTACLALCYFKGGFNSTAIERKLTDFKLVTNLEDTEYDFVWICIDSTALRSGNLLKELSEKFADTKTVIIPSFYEDTKELINYGFKPENVVTTSIGMLSWQSPLKNERFNYTNGKEGIAYYFFSPDFFCSEDNPEAVNELVRTFRLGRHPAEAVTKDANKHFFKREIIQMVSFSILAGLEHCNWKFSKFRKDNETLRVVVNSIHEISKGLSHIEGQPELRMMRFIHPIFIKFFLLVVPLIIPFDFESFVEFHFNSKVHTQTKFYLSRYQEKIEENTDMPVTNLKTLISYINL